MPNITYYKVLPDDNRTAGGLGQGGGVWWTQVAGIALQQEIARLMDVPLVFQPRLHGKDSFDCQDYEAQPGEFEIVYCQLFECPRERPKGWIYTMVSDYIGMDGLLNTFLDRVRPDLVISLQYPLEPPESLADFPQLGKLPNLAAQCEHYGARVEYLPWFNAQNIETYEADKPLAGMCTGKMSGTYPMRDACWRYLQKLNRSDIVLSGNPTGSTFTLIDEDYHRALATTRYYFSGGIYDLQIPPKYYEVCNYGACLVSPAMPMMEVSGFVAGQTYLPIQSVDEIPMILHSDDWRDIAPRGQQMVHQRHGLTQRARDIIQLYHQRLA
jgi:hypothetical protein